MTTMTMKARHKQLLLHLVCIEPLGPVVHWKIVKGVLSSTPFAGLFEQKTVQLDADKLTELGQFLERIYELTHHDMRRFGLTDKQASQLLEGLADTDRLDEELDLVTRHVVAVDTFFDAEFPVLLRNIIVPPLLLYRKGAALGDNDKCCAIVGARKGNDYAQRVIGQFVPALVAHDWNIISGGAFGVDTFAHEQALRSKGRTTVVLGSGLHNISPYGQRPLYERILNNGGTLLTAFSMKYQTNRSSFPMRNRIIAGCSQVSVVVQAAEKSGALITAEYALEEGRMVAAVPGDIFDELSAGCHKILRAGACMVTKVEDLFTELGYEAVASVPKKLSTPDTFGIEGFAEFLATPRNHEEVEVFLVAKGISDVNDLLFEYQLQAKIEQNFTGMWLLKR
jgi:DNA processing protein